MRFVGYLAGVMLLSACSSQTAPQLRTGLPSLHTAQVALDAGAPQMALGICTRIVASEGRNVDALAVRAMR